MFQKKKIRKQKKGNQESYTTEERRTRLKKNHDGEENWDQFDFSLFLSEKVVTHKICRASQSSNLLLVSLLQLNLYQIFSFPHCLKDVLNTLKKAVIEEDKEETEASKIWTLSDQCSPF